MKSLEYTNKVYRNQLKLGKKHEENMFGYLLINKKKNDPPVNLNNLKSKQDKN